MPIYGYKCGNCGEVFEERKEVEERHFGECPKCGCIADVVIQGVNFTVGMKWAEDRREHFGREFEKRRCERPKAYG